MDISRTRIFDDRLKRLRERNYKVYTKCCGVLSDVEASWKPVAKSRADDRLPGQVKYDLGDGYRLVLQKSESAATITAVFVGSHDDTERFLDGNIGRIFSARATTASKTALRAKGQLPKERQSSRPMNNEETKGVRQDRIFDAVDEALFTAIGIPERMREPLRSETEADSPLFLELLGDLEREHPEAAQGLLNYATDPSLENLRALGAIRSRASAIRQAEFFHTGLSVSSAQPEVLGTPEAALPAIDVPIVEERAAKKPKQASRGKPKRATRNQTAKALKSSRQRRTAAAITGRPLAKKKVPSKVGKSAARRLPASRTTRTVAATKRLTPLTVKRYLTARNFPLIDHRDVGGGMWVVAGKRAFASVAAELGRRGVHCKFYPAGSRKREMRASWLIDAFRRLGKY